jgi:hypothetical protein
LQRQASRSGMTSKAGKTLVRNTIPSFDNYRLTKFRNWRHTANIARISKDPTMGSLPTLQAPKSAGRITHPRHRRLIYQASKGS